MNDTLYTTLKETISVASRIRINLGLTIPKQQSYTIEMQHFGEVIAANV